MITCRATRTYAEPLGPDNRCGAPVAGFSIYLSARKVARLLEGEDDDPVPEVEPIPIGYCAEHLTRYDEATQTATISHPGEAFGVLWIQR